MFLEAAAGMEGSTPTSGGHLLCVPAPLAYLKSRVGKEASPPAPRHDHCVPDTYCSVTAVPCNICIESFEQMRPCAHVACERALV